MAESIATFKPPWAVTTWCDDRFIYVELPCKEGAPYIFKESLTEGGLSRVLHLMRDSRRKAAPRITGDFNAPINAAVKIKRRQAVEGATEQQREDARNILKKLRMIGK